MIEPDASERECVGWPDASDASDAFRAGEDDAKRHAAEAPRGGRTPKKKGDSRMRVCAVARASEERAEGRAALLDRFSPSLPGDPQDPRPGEEPPEPYEYATVCEVQHALWPLLATVRHTGIALVRLSLTSPNEGTILADGASFAAEIGARSGEGAFLVRDLGPAHGRNHFYGFTLSHDEEHPRKRWCAITQAYGRLVKSNVATGWWGEPAEAYRNVEGMLRYAFKAWPAEYGRRSVAGDVLASGGDIRALDGGARHPARLPAVPHRGPPEGVGKALALPTMRPGHARREARAFEVVLQQVQEWQLGGSPPRTAPRRTDDTWKPTRGPRMTRREHGTRTHTVRCVHTEHDRARNVEGVRVAACRENRKQG